MTSSVFTDKESKMTYSAKRDCKCASTESTADVLKALGHPVRLRIVEELHRRESCCCQEVCGRFTQSQSTISQHLSVLTDAGVVKFERNGNKSRFTLNRNVFEELQGVFDEFRTEEADSRIKEKL